MLRPARLDFKIGHHPRQATVPILYQRQLEWIHDRRPGPPLCAGKRASRVVGYFGDFDITLIGSTYTGMVLHA